MEYIILIYKNIVFQIFHIIYVHFSKFLVLQRAKNLFAHTNAQEP